MYSISKKIKVALLGITLTTAASGLHAQNVSVNADWEGHKADKICYAVSFPTPDSAASSHVVSSRYITVTHRPDEGIKNEIAFVSGFPEEFSIEGSVTIDNNLPYKLLSYKGVGFVQSGDKEATLSSQMRAGKVMEVKWTTPNGEYFVDRYSLIGFTSTHNFINNCG